MPQKPFLPRIHPARVIRGTFRNVCPRCGKTKVFRRVFHMASSCEACGYVYDRESGYFIGAAVVGYFIGAFSLIPTLAVGIVKLEYPFQWVIVAASLQLIVLLPLLFRFTRLLWIHFDYDADPA